MTKLVYYNKPAGPPPGKRRPTNKPPGLLRPMLLLALFAGMLFSVGLVAYKAAPKAAAVFSNWRKNGVNSWQFQTAEIKGLPPEDLAAMASAVPFKPGQNVTQADADALAKNLADKFPHLKNISVKRGLFSGKLRVSAAQRVPSAVLVMASPLQMLVDGDGVIYPVQHHVPFGSLPLVSITSAQGGNPPEKVSKEFVQLVNTLGAYQKDLDFTSIVADSDGASARVILKDSTAIDFGGVQDLAKKAKLSSKILEYSKARGVKPPFVIDFSFYSYGKVYIKPYG